jgi:hypothetical protein
MSPNNGDIPVFVGSRPTTFGDEGDHVAIGSKRLRQYTLTLGRFNLIKNLN